MSSFGEELKRERELRQITLREISEATKISLRYLEALERNDFRHLPGGVFNKGFVRAYSQFIGVDPEAMVNAYLLEEQDQEARRRQQRGEPPPRRAEPDAGSVVRDGRPPNRGTRSTAWLVVSFFLLLVAVGLLAGMLVLWLKRGRAPDATPGHPGKGASVRRAERVETDA